MTKTIKQLYDEGQRQFPMRGGGISHPIEYDDENECFWSNGFKWFAPCGNVQMHDDDLDLDDLLPIPPLDHQARLKAAENHIAEIAKCDEINREQFAMDYFRLGERLEVLQAKYEALVKACEPFLDKLSLRDKRDAETGSYLWNDSHIEMHQAHFRNLTKAIRGE